jgi:hypothetical protein
VNNTALHLFYAEVPTSTDPVEDISLPPMPKRSQFDRSEPKFYGVPLHSCSFRDAVAAVYDDLWGDFHGGKDLPPDEKHPEGSVTRSWFRMARALNENSTLKEISEVTGLRKSLQRLATLRAALYLRDRDYAIFVQQAVFSIYVYGTPAYRNYDRFRRARYEHKERRREWVQKYEGSEHRKAQKAAYSATPKGQEIMIGAERRRREANRSDPKFRAEEALRKRLAYYGVTDPKDLPQKSRRGRKAAMSAQVVRVS